MASFSSTSKPKCILPVWLRAFSRMKAFMSFSKQIFLVQLCTLRVVFFPEIECGSKGRFEHETDRYFMIEMLHEVFRMLVN